MVLESESSCHEKQISSMEILSSSLISVYTFRYGQPVFRVDTISYLKGIAHSKKSSQGLYEPEVNKSNLPCFTVIAQLVTHLPGKARLSNT